MRRGDLRSRHTAGLAVLVLFFGLTLASSTATTIPGDERPPLLAAEPAPAGLDPATRLVDYSVIPDASGVELVLRGDGGLPYELFTLTAPDRLVFDLPGVVASVDRKRAEIGANGVVRVRVGQYREDPAPVARVVLELDHPLAYQIQRDGGALRIRLTGLAAGAAPRTIAGEERPVAAAAPAAETSQALARPTPAFAVATTGQADAANLRPTADTIAGEAPPPQPAVEQIPPPDAPAAPVWVETPQQAEAPAAAPKASETWTAAPLAPAQAEPPAAEAPTGASVPLPVAEAKTIQDQRRNYTGAPVSLNLMDADIRQVFSLFHELSGVNFVLDPAVSGTVTIIVDEVPWDQALDLILQNNGLEMVVEGNVFRIAPVVKLAQEAAQRRTLRDAKELEATPVTITRTLSYAKANEVDRVVREAMLSQKGRVIVDNRTNTLIIRDIPDRVEAIDTLLTTLDAETPQVMIEARIVEVSRDFVQDLGIRWGATASMDQAHGTQTNLQFPHRANAAWALNLPKNPGASALSFSFGNVLDSFTLDITLDALEQEGYAKRLSAPRVATQNNEPAEIEQGVRFPIVRTTATEIETEFVSASLRMRVVPQITAEGTVILDLQVWNDQPDFVRQVQDVPSINTQRAQTKVLIADGGTTVIGGIFTVNEGKATTGVPWFSKLPGLGWLFRSKTITSLNRELLIFVTPRIVKAS